MKYNPHKYQEYAEDFIIEHEACALLLDMGLGKTIITLSALWKLVLDHFEVGKVLIIAPLRVAKDTWPKEIKKWDHLNGLTASLVVGNKCHREKALNTKANIYIINRENIEWLISNYKWDFDMVVIDELSSFKSNKSKRFKALRKVRPMVKRIVGLTGTPAPNGLMDLWAQINLLDMGERLGRFIGGIEKDILCRTKETEILFFHIDLKMVLMMLYIKRYQIYV